MAHGTNTSICGNSSCDQQRHATTQQTIVMEDWIPKPPKDLALENEIEACEMDEYGHFIGCIEQPTPMPEKDLQMLRLGVSRRNKEDEVLWAIEDLIGESQSWPKCIQSSIPFICWELE